jgi:hypothetical protein
MKKINTLLLASVFLFACKKDTDSSSGNSSQIKWKIFKVQSKVNCSNPSDIQPFTGNYINFWILSGGTEEPNSTFTPKPNTWYKVNSSMYLKTTSDVTPINESSGAYFHFNAGTTSYTQPCQ